MQYDFYRGHQARATWTCAVHGLDAQPILFLQVPCPEACVQPFINIIALQLLSYHLALFRGHNVDQPRNLAKPVTVADLMLEP